MAEPSFSPVATSFMTAAATSSNIAIPAGGTIAAVTNLGLYPAFLAIGTSGTLAASAPTGFPVLPGEQTYITIGSATTLAAVTLQQVTGLTITSGN